MAPCRYSPGWTTHLPANALAKCLVKIERLAELGHELRRPEADPLRDKIYELRVGLRGINHRLLYFFHGDAAAVLAHGLVKESAVPAPDIERAIQRRSRFLADLKKHTYKERIEMKQKEKTSDALAILHRRFIAGKPERLAEFEKMRADDAVARKLLKLRTVAGLSQRELAKLVGTTASVICRLEDADYAGHSLAMLHRIAAALDRRVEIRFVPARASKQRKASAGRMASARHLKASH